MKFRDYQININKAQDKFMESDDNRGQVYSPTGSGKTVCFMNLIRKSQEYGLSKILVVHPRIALSLDQQTRFSKEFRDSEFTSFHSGAVKQTEDSVRLNTSTTDPKALQEILDTSTEYNIVFTSYHSLAHIANLEWDLVICDEAHFLPRKQFRDSLELFRPFTKVIFYTATPIHLVAEDEGMDNVELFGIPIIKVEPAPLMEKGYIAGIRLRMLEIQTKVNSRELANAAKTIALAYLDQKQCVSDKIPHKMLVAMSGTTLFDEIMDDLPKIREIVGELVDVYYITGTSQNKNGHAMQNRESALEDFANNQNLSIIMHCDTLAEGIDVDGLFGAFLFRTLSQAKFLQTIGRTARPYKSDLNKHGEIKNMEKRIKPHSIITIPMVNNEFYANVDSKELCEAFIEAGYDKLTSYLDPEYMEYGAKGGDDFDFDIDDEKMKFADILSYEVNEIKLDLRKHLGI